jgi:hypothetical protein
MKYMMGQIQGDRHNQRHSGNAMLDKNKCLHGLYKFMVYNLTNMVI